ncbi:ARF GAP-like zinc finger-containing protein [Histomonas meleagridis]|nr:ARF GAP-like zinc finger-containing protein [Histomonas meleagridis]
MNLSPLHMSTLLHRYDMVMELKEHVAATEKTFQHYAECGRQLCECMEKLSGTFQRYDEFKSDPALQSISELLISFSSTLKSHYDQVDQHIITSLKTFIKKDIGRVEEDNRRVSHCIDTYNKLVEQFVQINKKKPGADQEEKEARMMASHWQAVYSSFMFNRSLDYVERKKLLEITGTMLMFINLVALAYKECLFSFDDAKDSFSNLQLALPVSSDEVNNFEKNTDILGKSLEGYYTLYWKRLKVSFTHTPAINHEGYLWKKGSGFTKSWQKRYFICQNHTLSYFHGTEDSDKPQGILPLLLTTVKPIKDPERRFCFTIISQEKVYVLQALTEWDMNEWIAVIQNNIQYLLDHSGEDIKETTTFTKDSSNDSPLSVECNCVCADCGAPNPVWCCINWGVCICINCSGVHRSLTTSVSKVRSLTLDRLDPTTNKLFF